MPSPPASLPARQIGFWMAVALVIGNMIGSGVFLLPASLAAYGGGVSLLGWLVSTAGAILLALVFARLARIDPAAGGPYAYTRRAFGDLAGFLIAWGYWISVWCSNAALAVAFVGYLDPFMPHVVRSPAGAAALAIAAVWAVTAVNILGVRTAGTVQVATTALKIVPLLLVGIAGLASFAPSHFAITQTGAVDVAKGLSATATLTLFAFLGLECATIPAASIRDPNRTIPRATIVGTLLSAGVYIVSTIGVMSLIAPSTLSQTTAPFAAAARVLAGDRAAALVALGAAISCFGALNGWVLVVGQLPLAAAQDGLFPGVFARRSARGTPDRGMVIAAGLSSALIAMNYTRGLVGLFTFVILLATLSTVVPYAFCSLAGLVIARREGRGRAVASRAASVVGALAFGYSLWAIYGAGPDAVFWGFLLLLMGLPLYRGTGLFSTDSASSVPGLGRPRPGTELAESVENRPVPLLLVKHARDAFRSRERIAGEWQDLNFAAAPDFARAVDDDERFLDLLRQCGAELLLLPASEGVGLDSIYVRDASVATPRGVVLCRMGKPQRAGEPAAHGTFLRSQGYPIIGTIQPPGTLEGGDVAWLDARTIIVGRGYRTNDAGIRQLRTLVGNDVDEFVEVPLPHWRGAGDVFHLMSILSPVGRDVAVVYSPLLPMPFREWLLARGVTLVEVPDAEFDTMGANVLPVGPHRCVMVAGNPTTRARLERAGLQVFEYDGREISLKGGGGPTCLTRPLARLRR